MKLIQNLADIICNTLLDPEALDRSRNSKGAFTRNCGKLPYWTLMKLVLKNVRKTISASLDEFFHEMRLMCVAFDVLNNRVLDAQLESISVDERTLAINHMENIKSKARTNL